MFCVKVCMNHEKVRDEVVFLKKAQVVFLPHTQAMKTKHDQLLENVPDTTDGICHIFIFKGAAFSH